LPPGLQSLRIDKWGGTAPTNGYMNVVGDDLPMLDYDTYVLLAPGETLIGVTLPNGPAQPAGPGSETSVANRVSLSFTENTEPFTDPVIGQEIARFGIHALQQCSPCS
jgi:hypothetical protein